MNKVLLIGYLGRDAELKRTQAGRPLVGFTVATTAKWKDDKGQRQERTEWHRCTAWGDRWERVLPYLHKGAKVCVEGEVRYREGETKDGVKAHYTDIHVNEIELISTRRDDEHHRSKPLGSGKRQAAPEQVDDELPF